MNGFDCSIDDASNLLTSLHSFCVWVHFLSLALSTTLSVRGPSLVPSAAGTSRISRGKLHNKQNSFEYERVEAQMIQILPLDAAVDCSMDNFCMSSMGKLNRKSGLPNVVAKDFFTKWLLFADALASFDEPSTNWMDVLPGKIGMAKAHIWELRGRKVYWYRYGHVTLTSPQFLLFIGHFFTIITECGLHQLTLFDHRLIITLQRSQRLLWILH